MLGNKGFRKLSIIFDEFIFTYSRNVIGNLGGIGHVPCVASRQGTPNQTKPMQARLTFPSRRIAQQFATDWGRHTLTGHSMGATKPSGETSVDLYGVNDELREWINSKVAEINATIGKGAA